MSKELEALKELRLQVGSIHYYDMTGGTPKETTLLLRDSEPFKIVETALNRLERLEKVLKIINEKQVMLPIFMTICALYGNEALKEYNSTVGKGRKLTKTEFNLLKEYLK